MARIQTNHHEPNKPTIDREKVDLFFRERANKIASIGPIKAIIYQESQGDLAEKRDSAEISAIEPMLALNKLVRILDIGCGTGRWAKRLIGKCGYYHGIDNCKDLINYAAQAFPATENFKFSVADACNFSLQTIKEKEPFDVILCAGVLIYLNDDELAQALKCIAKSMSSRSTAIFREPIGIENRLTIQNHYSNDMNQYYSAIYRTETELRDMVSENMVSLGCHWHESGDVFDDNLLNNRKETKQRWFIIKRTI
ncbi:MAG: class I SAM-dependent methyltransferase [Burkholderiaceae bacterium]|jgi:SAM-dependent methyltransferase|nr:class I SAM-dependent methyltransferase [Burkholderiaceae bacterium]